MTPHTVPGQRSPASEPLRASAISDAFAAVRGATERLASPLSPEDCTVQSMPDASPVKWHLAHTSWFFETFVLEPWLRGYRVFEPQFRVLFNSYYNSVGAQHARPQRGLVTRPGLDAVRDYRAHVDGAMQRYLAANPSPEALAVVELGLQHEQQHQELVLTDVKHLLAANPLRPVYRASAVDAATAPPIAAARWQRYADRIATIGHDGRGFAFDNEQPAHRVLVPDFELASRPVTNGEYLEFVRDSGYARPEHWLSDGWNEVRSQGWQAPLYWEEHEGEWSSFTLAGMRGLRPDEPVVHLSFYEADAYARWAGARLPTEFEWEVAGSEVPVAGNFSDSGRLHPAAASLAATTAVVQLFGDVWEWTSSAYGAYPGYRPAAGALGEYNGKFMCNQLVLRGGSCASPPGHLRPTYRNFFPPSARWQFSGVRLARDTAPTS